MAKFVMRIKWLLDWRFLPSRFQMWSFGTGTRVVEFISGIGLLGFALVFWLDADLLLHYPIYYKFQHAPSLLLVSMLGSVGIMQLWAMLYWSHRSNIISGYLLIAGSLIWALVSVAFWAAYPPAHTGMVLPPILVLLCVLAGRNLINFSKFAEGVEKKAGG